MIYTFHASPTVDWKPSDQFNIFPKTVLDIFLATSSFLIVIWYLWFSYDLVSCNSHGVTKIDQWIYSGWPPSTSATRTNTCAAAPWKSWCGCECPHPQGKTWRRRSTLWVFIGDFSVDLGWISGGFLMLFCYFEFFFLILFFFILNMVGLLCIIR